MSEVAGRGKPTGVVVITGTGGMGRAIAHRLAPGRHVVLADRDEGALDDVAAAISAIGHVVTTQRVDVSDGDSVAELARVAADLGPVVAVVHTAGVSPVHASAEAVIACRICLGSMNRTSSRRTSNSSTSVVPRSRKNCTRLSTSSSGADAPEEIPTTRAPSSHASWT